MLYPVAKQAYKLKLLKRKKIYDVFYMSLLKQNTIRKKQVDEKVNKLEFEAGNSKEYKVEAIWNSVVYANKAEDYLLGLYYLVL